MVRTEVEFLIEKPDSLLINTKHSQESSGLFPLLEQTAGTALDKSLPCSVISFGTE